MILSTGQPIKCTLSKHVLKASVDLAQRSQNFTRIEPAPRNYLPVHTIPTPTRYQWTSEKSWVNSSSASLYIIRTLWSSGILLCLGWLSEFLRFVAAMVVTENGLFGSFRLLGSIHRGSPCGPRAMWIHSSSVAKPPKHPDHTLY